MTDNENTPKEEKTLTATPEIKPQNNTVKGATQKVNVPMQKAVVKGQMAKVRTSMKIGGTTYVRGEMVDSTLVPKDMFKYLKMQ